MDRTVFEIEVDKLFRYFRYKEPDPGYASVIYEQVEHVPNDVIGRIVQWIMREYDTMPRNLGKAIRAGWHNHRANTPQKCVDMPETPCPECHGTGMLWADKVDKFGKYTWVFRCGFCQNWRRQLPEISEVPIVRRHVLKQNGYEVWNPMTSLPGPKERSALNAMIGESLVRGMRE